MQFFFNSNSLPSLRQCTIICLICFCGLWTYGQEVLVSGVVTDHSGMPIPGASVVVKGTINGVATDFDGNFSIRAKSSDILIISFLGFSDKEISVGNQRNLNVVLQEDVSQLNEVVVVAYGTSKKEAFTGSAAFMETEQIQEAATSNLSQALQGLSSGIQVISNSGRPGQDANIQIRGFGSLSADSNPLIVLNGSPYEGALSSIAPSEIDNISVLKDASSTSLYGSRAANGVILITTKSGTVGKTEINFRHTLGTSDFAVKLPRKLNAAEQYEAVWEGFYFDNLSLGRGDDVARSNASRDVTDRFYIARPHTNFLGQTRRYRSNWNIDEPVGLDGKIKPEAQLLYEYDWHDVFNPQLRQEYGFDVSSGLSENTRLFFSSTYLLDKGQYFNQNFDRWSTRLNINSKLGKRINLEASMLYLRTNQDNPGEFARVIRTIPQTIHPYEFNHEEGGFFTDSFGNLALQKGGGQSYSGRRFFGTDNPFDYINAPKESDAYAFDINSTNQIVNKLGISWDILEGITFRTSIISDFSVFQRHLYRAPVEGLVETEGLAFKASNSRFSYTFNNILEYKKLYGNHNFGLLAGQEMYSWNRNNLSGSGTIFAVPGLFELDATSAEPLSSSNETDYRLVSGFSRFTYDYKNKAYLNASYRADASSRFSPKKRWGNFWSVGGAWRLSEEEFLKNSKFVNNLKLKASYGTTGNDQIALYAYQALYDTGYNFYENSGAIESRLPTPELGWEKNIQSNFGLEFQLFNRLRANVEYFVKSSDDLLFAQPLPPSFGITSFDANIAKVENRGFEIDLRYDILKNRDLNWSIGFNATHYRNEIVELPVEEVLTSNYRWAVGQSIYDFWTPTWAGVDPDTGDNTWYINTLDANGNLIGQEISNNWGEVDKQENYAYQGSSLPDVFGGITNTIIYKGFDLSFMFYYSIGGVMLDNAFRENINMRNAFGLVDYWLDNHWTPDNPDAVIPRPSHRNFADNGRTTNQYMYENDFIRLRNLNIGYNFPRSFTDILNIKAFKLFVQADNLITWGNAQKRGTDPEIAGFDGSSDYNWGVRKTISGGVNIQF